MKRLPLTAILPFSTIPGGDRSSRKSKIANGFRLFAILLLLLAVGGPAGAVTYSTDHPNGWTAGGPTFLLTINRTIDFIAGEEGFSSDEMNTFLWIGPAGTVPLPAATLINPTQVTITLDRTLFVQAGHVTIQYTADPNAVPPDRPESRLISFTVNPPPQISTTNLPDAVEGTPYQAPLNVTGGTAPYKWTLTGGASGLTLNPDNGVISGTPGNPGTFRFTVQVSDFSQIGAQKQFTLVVNAAGSVVARDDTYAVVVNRPISANVTGNDTYDFSSSRAVSLVTSPNHGTVQLSTDSPGSFTYTPALGFTGQDSFVYKLTSSGKSSAATVTIVVAGGGSAVCAITPATTVKEDIEVLDFNVSVTFNGTPLSGAPLVLSIGGKSLQAVTINGFAAFQHDFALSPGSYSSDVADDYQSGDIGPSFRCSGMVYISDHTALVALNLCFCLFSRATGQATFNCGHETANAAPRGDLDLFRQFRDKVLIPQPRGADYAQLYYKFRPELLRIMLAHPALLLRSRDKIQHYVPLVEAMLRGERVTITPSEAREVGVILASLEEPASPELRKTLREIRHDLSDPQVLASLGVTLHDSTTPRSQTELREAFARVPLHFEANQNPKDPNVRYVSRGPGYDIHLKSTEAEVSLHDHAGPPIRMKLDGAASGSRIAGESLLPGVSNYLLGPSPRDWRIGVPQYARVKYDQVYPGVDLVYYGNQQQLEYDLVISPRSSADGIRFSFGGVDRIDKTAEGDLKLSQAGDDVILRKPVAYQEIAGARQSVDVEYALLDRNRIAFRLGRYDRERPLIIDPILSYASLAGGSGLDFGMAVAVDSAGNAYVTGATTSATLQASPVLFKGGGQFQADGFVTKFDPSGSKILYSTYFGGSNDDVGVGITVDAQGNAYVTGATRSSDFPTLKAFQSTFGGGGSYFNTDAFLLKLDPSGRISYSTYLGGSGDDGARGVALDSSGNIYIAGLTSSTDFPLLSVAVQTTNRGGTHFHSDGFVAKLNPSGSLLLYSTYLGGSGDDFITSMAVDPAGNAYVTGVTYSNDFPVSNPFQKDYAGSADVFVAKLNPNGSALLYSTYLGGDSDDFGSGIAIDAQGNAYLTGYTGSSRNFPILNAAQPYPGSADGLGFDSFITKLNPAGSALVYSTFLGGSGRDLAYAIAVDSQGNAYVTGETDSSDFASAVALQSTSGGNLDAFLAKLNASGNAFEYRTYLGGNGDDGGMGVAVDNSGNAYVVGSVTSSNPPATTGAFQTRLQGLMDGFVVKIAAGSGLPAVSPVSSASFSWNSGIAPNSIASGLGMGLGDKFTAAPGTSLPTALDNVTLTLKDSAGTQRLAPLYFVAPQQISFVVPQGTQPGLASITVSRNNQVFASGMARIDAVAPGIFTANATGFGPPAGLWIRVAANGAQSQNYLFDATKPAGSRNAVPVDLGPAGDQVFLSLYGTGFRGAGRASATVGGVSAPVSGFAAVGLYQGEDVVNIGPLPRSLAGKGEVQVVLLFDGKPANTTTVSIR